MPIAYRDTDWGDIRSWQTNRDRKTEPKLGRGWCRRCDRDEIGYGEQCRVCGFRSDTKRRKK